MKLHVLTDLHLEFGQFTLHGGDVLLLCGDIVIADYLNRTDYKYKYNKIFNEFFVDECAKYDRVYMIMGNHEHYYGVFEHTADILRNALKDTKVTLLEKEFVDLNEKWRLFGATLWTDHNNRDWFVTQNAKERMNDHNVIMKADGTRFHPIDACDDHDTALKALQDGMCDKDTIVMTHHAPTTASIHYARFGNDTLNYAYATDLEELIFKNPNIKFWFHGHTHNVADYEVGNCRIISNPRGYRGYEIVPGFKADLEIEI